MGRKVTVRHNSDGTKTTTTRYTHKNLLGGTTSHVYQKKEKDKGCYVATCVYGTYDCPEVWTLRRYRDFKLAESKMGRAFISCYYTVSPTVVKLFGNTKLFHKVFKSRLDCFVKRLNQKGYQNTPYDDKPW